METENLSSFFNFLDLKADNSPGAYPRKKKEPTSKASDFSYEKVQNTKANAAQLGIYSLDQIKLKGLQALELKDFSPITRGSYLSGQYVTRVIYLENGQSGGNLSGRFIINNEYRVQGQPSQSNQSSSQGQFPVNGQYYNQGAYPSQISFSSDRVLNGQYAVSSSDIANQQFSISGIVGARGDVLEAGPYFITKAELLNGGYQLRVQNLDHSSLQVNSLNVQLGGQKVEQGQLLVNGINSVEGIIRPLDQFSQRATLLIDGSYDSEGKFIVNGVTLENGSNKITTRYTTGRTQGSGSATIDGRYTSGGQFIVSLSNSTVSSPGDNKNSGSQSNFELIQQQFQQAFNAFNRPQPGRILKLQA